MFKDSMVKTPGVEIPSIRVEEPPPRERSFHRRAKETIKNIFVRRSHSPATSQGTSERGDSQENLPSLGNITRSNVGDKTRSVEIEDNRGHEYLKPTDLETGRVDTGSEEAKVNVEETSVHLPTIFQDAVRESGPEDHAIGTGSEQGMLGEAKDRENRAQRLAVPKHPRHVHNDEITGDDTSRCQSSDIGAPSEQEITHRYTQDSSSHLLHGAHHFTIGGNPPFENTVNVKNEYNSLNNSGTYAITTLKESVSFKALYDSSAQDPTRRVHPETRQRVLKCIRDWIDTPSAKERIFWLHGPAGVGKSAIAQTIARSCSREQLAATFFFFRSDPARNDGNRLFTTLAWQFAFAIPATKNPIIHSLNEHPDIPTKEVEAQFEELIVKPFLALKKSGVELSAPVVIIDGVDECSDDSLQRRCLKLIGNAVKYSPIPLRFLICSRPEAHIQDTMDIFRSLTLPLDLAKLDDANQDIEKYFRVEFARIASEQELDPLWPSEEIIQEFIYKASGQFIYAATVIKYVGDEYSNAETQLEIIRGLKPPSNISPFAELDELYKEILRRQRDPAFLKDFLSLLIGRLTTEKNDLHEDDTLLMNVSKRELHRKLRGMRSILKFEPYIDVHHRSFLDFLQDLSRSGEYHINKEAGARRYLDLIVGSLVRHTSTVHEQHIDHFNPRFYHLSALFPADHVLSTEEWQQALQPLLEVQDKFLALQNCRTFLEFLSCGECIGSHIIRNLLLQLAVLRGSCGVPNSALMAQLHIDKSEQIQSSLTLLNLTGTQMNALSKDVDACLSLLLPRLQNRNLGLSFDTVTIQLFCSLLQFDHIEAAMRLRSLSHAQNLLDLIDEFINTEHFGNDIGPNISCKAVLLVLEILARIPALPRSLFSKGTVDPHHNTHQMNSLKTELLFQTAFMSKILDSRYVVQEQWDVKSVPQWRKCSNPSLITQIRIMFGVAKAIQYFHSMGVVLHDWVDSDYIFLDAELHPRFLFLGLIVRYINMAHFMDFSERYISREQNVLLFGCLFYEMCFGTKINYGDRISRDKKEILAKLANRPSKPKIGDNVWQLIKHCCARDPKSRLSMDTVVKEMEGWDIFN